MVIRNISIKNDGYPDNPKCSRCGKEPAGPFFYWDFSSNQNLCLCGDCGVKVEKGLIADLIQLSATVRLRELYPEDTFSRVFGRQNRGFPDPHKNITVFRKEKPENAS